jgi:hypothetical protein
VFTSLSQVIDSYCAEAAHFDHLTTSRPLRQVVVSIKENGETGRLMRDL